jgi:hypothetical protein
VAMARMGRMVVIPFGLRDGGGVHAVIVAEAGLNS